MKAVIFTYHKDFKLAGVAARALKKIGVEVFFAIDEKDINMHIDGGSNIITNFKRGGNLNGIQCVNGILDTMKSVCNKEDEWVLKVDSDTFVKSLGWLPENESFIVAGTSYGEPDEGEKYYSMFGCCYAIRPSGIDQLKDKINEIGEGVTRAEDRMIGNAASALNAYKRYRLYADPHMAPFKEKNSIQDNCNADYICIQRTGHHPEAREEVFQKMTQMYNFLYE